MKKLLIMMVAATMLLGCQKEESPAIDSGDGSVKFTSGIATRANGTQWANSDEIGVYMLKSADKAVIESNVKYRNGAIAGVTATFATTTPIYYPFIGNVDFLAYYPYTSTALTDYDYSLNVTDQTDLPSIDLMTADKLNIQKTDQTQDLTFSHKLSNIELTIVGGEGLVGADFEGLTVKLIGTEATGTYNIYTDVIVLTDGATEITLHTTDNGNSAEGIVIPQSFTDVKLTFKLDGKVDAVATIASGSFNSGKKHAYTVTLNRNAAKLSGTTITPWDNGTGGNLDALPPPPFNIVQSGVGAVYDYAILNATENSFFYNYHPDGDEYTTVNNSNREIKNSVYFKDGLPTHIITNDYTIIFENYRDKLVDFVVIATIGDNISEYRDVSTSLDWENQVVGRPVEVIDRIVWDQKAIISLVDAICTTLPPAFILDSFNTICTGGSMDIINDILPNVLLDTTVPSTILPSGSTETAEEYFNGYINEVNVDSDILQADRAPDVVLGTGYLTSGTGVVKITLSWDFAGDVDLYCMDPNGITIFHRNPKPDSGGELDVDNIEGPGVENIFWEENAPIGNYVVSIHNYNGMAGNYTVTVKMRNKIELFSGTLPAKIEAVSIGTFILSAI